MNINRQIGWSLLYMYMKLWHTDNKIMETSFLQTEYYEGYTQKLQKQIEDQQQLISKLESKLSATRQPPG